MHLEALGAVLRATSILAALKRRYSHGHVTWVTQAPADQLLQHNPGIDRVLTTSNEDLLSLRALQFDLALVIDKSLKAGGVLALTQAKEIRGFRVDPKTSAILPANAEAEELWQLGLSDHLKFHVNRKPETQLMLEALGLGPFRRDEYQIHMTSVEKSLAESRRRQWLGRGEFLIGLNTGCSGVIPYKRWTVEYHQKLIRSILENFNAKIVLLGGPEDTLRNQRIAAADPRVIESPTSRGLRDGLASVAACDQVITGDSLGMHMAIALRKWVIAWFGPTCAHEIDLYDRGLRLRAEVACGPCWKRSCSLDPMCYDQVPLERVLEAIEQGQKWKISLSKPPFSETLSSAFP